MTALTWENVYSEAARGANPERPLTRSLDLGEEGLAMHATRTCSIDGCEKPVRARQMCSGHWQSWRKAAQPAEVNAYGQACTMPGCSKPHSALGYCQMHRERVRRHGDPNRVGSHSPMGPRNHQWKGDGLGYRAAHNRIEVRRGRAAGHLCRCGRPAAEWAYDHTDPAEMFEPRRGPYSADPDRYQPMCVPCHRSLDATAREKRGGSD